MAILYASGNRDERHYPDADRFLVDRNPVDHLSFGYGVHGCAGQGLARLEASALLASFARRVVRFEVGQGELQPSNMTRSLASLPLTVTDRA